MWGDRPAGGEGRGVWRSTMDHLKLGRPISAIWESAKIGVLLSRHYICLLSVTEGVRPNWYFERAVKPSVVHTVAFQVRLAVSMATAKGKGTACTFVHLRTGLDAVNEYRVTGQRQEPCNRLQPQGHSAAQASSTPVAKIDRGSIQRVRGWNNMTDADIWFTHKSEYTEITSLNCYWRSMREL